MKRGKGLLMEHGLSCASAYYSKNGGFYSPISGFPVALFDPNGFVVIHTEDELQHAPFQYGIRLNVSSPGISAHPRYKKCPHSHW